jgi:hypothetical protein
VGGLSHRPGEDQLTLPLFAVRLVELLGRVLVERAALGRGALTARFVAGRAGALPFTSAFSIWLEVLNDPPAATGQVPLSGFERLADVLEQVARVAAYLALQILERGFGGLDRGPQTVERCATCLFGTAGLRHVFSLRIVPSNC